MFRVIYVAAQHQPATVDEKGALCAPSTLLAPAEVLSLFMSPYTTHCWSQRRSYQTPPHTHQPSCCPPSGPRCPHILPRQHVQHTLSPTDVIPLRAHLQLHHGIADREQTTSDTRWSSTFCSSTHAASAPGSMGRKLPVKTATACSAVVIQ